MGIPEQVTCIVTNQPATGSVTLKKTTSAGNTGLTSLSPSTFNLQLTAGGSTKASYSPSMSSFATSSGQATTLPAGTQYSFSEGTLPSAPTGTQWQAPAYSCTDGTTSLGSSFTLAANQNVTCTATNTLVSLPGSITIVKQVQGGANVPFSFQWTNGNGQALSSFFLNPSNGSDSTTVSNLPAGTYAVQENAASGWKLTGIVCSGASASITGNQAAITLGGGQTATCTFTNQQQQGTLKVVKAAIGGDDNFTFTANGSTFTMRNGGQQSFSLPAGTYPVSENSLPNGWKLQGATCTQGGTLTGNTIQATVTGNTTTTCTFTNFLQKDNKMGDVTKLYIHERVDNLISNQPDRARILRRLEGAPAPGLKDGGSYSEPTENASGAPGSLKDPVRSDLARLQGRTEGMGSSTIGDVKVSASLAQAQADAAAAERRKLSEAGLSAGAAPYNYAVLNPAFDVWMEAHYSSYADGLGGINREGQFGVLFAGADYVVRPGFLIGALVQVDRTVEDIKNPDLTGQVKGNGWMAGPYLGWKLSDHLYFDTRGAWGTSTNDIALQDAASGSRTGSFDTQRWLATAALTGNYQYGPLRITPQIELAYGSENSDAYRNSLGQMVDQANAMIGRLSAGPEFGYTTYLRNGVTIEPQVSFKGIWNFDDAPIVLSTGPVRAEPLRGEVETGIMVKTPGGYAVRASGSYDGIGDKNLEVWTAKGWVNIPLN